MSKWKAGSQAKAPSSQLRGALHPTKSPSVVKINSLIPEVKCDLFLLHKSTETQSRHQKQLHFNCARCPPITKLGEEQGSYNIKGLKFLTNSGGTQCNLAVRKELF